MTQMTIQQAMDLAKQLCQAGRLPEAEAVYRDILAAQPNQPDVLHLMGVVQFQAGRLDDAFNSINRAIQLNPTAARFHCNLGAVTFAKGRPLEAIECYRRAIELRPDLADAYYNMGNAFRAAGRGDESIAAYRQALAIAPQKSEVWFNLASLLSEAKQFSESIAAFRKVLELRPGLAEAHHNLATVLADAGQVEEAISEYQNAIASRPGFVEALTGLSIILRRAGRPEEARDAAQKAITLHPDSAQSHNLLGSALLDLGQFNQAISEYRQATALQPDYALAHSNLGLTLLLTRDFENGWAEHEWRLRAPELGRLAQQFPQPMWDGGELEGKTILLHAEQAFGDAIQFARFAPIVSQLGAEVILQCHPELTRLFQSLEGVQQVIARGDPLPRFDVHCPLLSLPHRLKTTAETIPAGAAYLSADKDLSARWRDRIGPDHLRVGLVWAGRRNYINDRNRSMSLSDFAPLAQVPNVKFFSLQKGEAAVEAQRAFDGVNLTDWTRELTDFADTAALLENLDLLIAVDTAAAHLAGAMGKPVWLLVPFVPDWRWMLDRADSPWYPSMRLFRQPRNGDWNAPITQIVQELQCLK